jgi:hypothetical protein
MKLRYDGTCAVCADDVPRGAEAEWDSERRTIVCLRCLDGEATVRTGVAGGSAQAMADRRRSEDAAKVARIKQASPVLGRIVLALDPEPDRGRTWSKGAVGERLFGGKLDELVAANAPVLVLHDRRFPRSQANIDHLAVTANGVWVIDAKHHKGQVTSVDRGTWRRPDRRLVVGGRERTNLVEGVRRQVDHVTSALGDSSFADVPVRGALCFIGADWTWFAKPFVVDGVIVAWGKAIRERLVEPGPVGAERRTAVQFHLARSFPAASRPA